MLRFQGAEHFRQRLVCSTLSGKAIRIDSIRADDESPGLRDYEASLLRLLEKATDGCVIEINETGVCRPPTPVTSPHAGATLQYALYPHTGTSLRYKPGIILGGVGLEHDCCPARGIGYYLEARGKGGNTCRAARRGLALVLDQVLHPTTHTSSLGPQLSCPCRPPFPWAGADRVGALWQAGAVGHAARRDQ